VTKKAAAERLLTVALTALAFILPISIAGTNMALALVLAGLLARLASGEPLEWRRARIPVTWCLCLYCGAAILTSVTGVSPSVSLHNLPKDFHKLCAFLILLLAFRATPARRLTIALALGFVFVAAAGIAQSVLDSYRRFLVYGEFWVWIRARAFVHPVTYGELLGFGLLGGLAFLLKPPTPAPGRLPAQVFLVLAGSALLLSQTRAAFLGVLAGFAAMCAAEPALRRWLKWGFAAAVLSVALMEALPTHRSLIASLRDNGVAIGANPHLNRFILWDVAWRIFKDHPWLGVGPANYATVFADYHQGLIEGQRVWGAAHNVFLHQLAERGLAGLTALAALWGVLLTRAWQRARARPCAWNLWSLAATTAFLFMNLTENAFQNEQVTTLFLFIWTRAEARQDAQP